MKPQRFDVSTWSKADRQRAISFRCRCGSTAADDQLRAYLDKSGLIVHFCHQCRAATVPVVGVSDSDRAYRAQRAYLRAVDAAHDLVQSGRRSKFHPMKHVRAVLARFGLCQAEQNSELLP